MELDGLDLDRDGRISTSTAAQNNTASRQITFDWDASGFQKTVDWVGANDGFLVLDQDVNRVVVNGATVQDSTIGQFELTSLASAGITGIDHNNSRYLSNAGFGRKVQRTMRECRSKASSRARLASSPRECCVRRYEKNSEIKQGRFVGRVSAHALCSSGSRAAGQQRQSGTAVLSMATQFGRGAT